MQVIPVARPLFGPEEEAAVLDVLRSGQLAQGERVAAFERRFAELCQVKEAIAVSSGTAALHLALIAHDIGYGDEVITTPFSFAATANVILLVGATPVFVDIDPETFNLDPKQVEAAITPRTRAILPVHLYGNPCDMARLAEIAERYFLVLIEDACQAHAASIEGKPVGSFGTGCFSFYPTKNMTTGEGGMVTTNDTHIAERVRLLRNHGQQSRYHHIALGFNLRMTDLQAAIGLVQLDRLEKFTADRISNAAYLSEKLAGAVRTPVVKPGYRHVFHQYTIRVPEGCDRDAWANQLRERGIGTGIHYPQTIYSQPYYQASPELYRLAIPPRYARQDAMNRVPTGGMAGMQLVEQDGLQWSVGTRFIASPAIPSYLPEAEKAACQVLSLPVHPALSREDLDTIVEEVLALCR
ncbi:MAG TPA: DegT/DnrJ/EryC1/StrS family aminotransferase [Ktedonobacteraceae bacterium]|nr:DegT/DnrJ/EryC1/StrS family aminotransferase [Ktedonobacteraceae bacterium]